MPRRYPLTPLSRLRAQQVADSAAVRRDQDAKTERAKGDTARAQLATRAHVDAVAKTNDNETARLEHGELRAADLVRHGAWAHVAARTTTTLKKAEGAQRLEQHRAEAALDEATRDLATRKREADVVAKHAERWSRAEASRSEEAQATEIEDRWRPR